MLPPELVGFFSGVTGAGIGASVTLLLGRNRPQADKQSGDATQIQALLASATYWEGQATRFKQEGVAWQKEATEWHDRFYRGFSELRVLGQATLESNTVARELHAALGKDVP